MESQPENSPGRIGSSNQPREAHKTGFCLETDDLRRYEALAAMADAAVHHRSLPELFHELAKRLHEVVAFDVASFSLHDPHKNVMQLHVWEGKAPSRAPAEVPIETSPSGWVWQHQKMLLMPELESEAQFQQFRNVIGANGIRCYCALPLTTAERRFGALGLGTTQSDAYSATDLGFLSRVADLVALSLENTVTRAAFQEEKDRLEALLKLSTRLLSNLDVQELLAAIGSFLGRMFSPDFACVEFYDVNTRRLRMQPLDFPLTHTVIGQAGEVKATESVGGGAFLHGETRIYNQKDLSGETSPMLLQLADAGIQSLCALPLITAKGSVGTMSLGSKQRRAFTRRDVIYLKHLAAQLALAMDNIAAYSEIAELTQKLKTEKLYLEDEICSAQNFEEVVGDSPVLKRALAQVDTVAPSDATVLILGETGTGKELIARAIHRRSARKDASFIKLNCAAIPTGLLESELFGHEKGAFTGAITQKVGRLELADKGTLFLDEIGDIPLELQPKLLRVLQDQEFERLGGTRTIKVNIRLIAATNRDLAKSVVAREFRSDLYYRLHVFPIRLPALRERHRDIPKLVRYFVQKFARRMNKHIEIIPSEAMNALANWYWPGNVRELENFVERSVILSEGTTLNVPLAELKPPHTGAREDSTLESLEREHILRVLRETGGVIAGVRGAAARLGIKRTTLQSRMQKMGITRDEFQN